MFAGRPGRGRQPKPPPGPSRPDRRARDPRLRVRGSAPDPELLRALKREVRDSRSSRVASRARYAHGPMPAPQGVRPGRGFTRWSSWTSSFAGRGTATRTWNAWTRSSVAPSSDAVPVVGDAGADPAEAIPGPLSRTPTASSAPRVRRPPGMERTLRRALPEAGRGAPIRSTTSRRPAAPASITCGEESRPTASRKTQKTRTAPGVRRLGPGDVANGNDYRGCAGTRGSTRWPSGSASRSSSARSRVRGFRRR